MGRPLVLRDRAHTAIRTRSRPTSRTSSPRPGRRSSRCTRWLVRVVDAIAPGGDTIAALFVNFVLAVVAMLLIGRLALRLTDDAEVAARAMMLFAVFPGSFVLSFAYSEAALIALCAACLLLLLDERWVLAGLVGALATATRPERCRDRRRLRRRVVHRHPPATRLGVARRTVAQPDRLRRVPGVPPAPHRRVVAMVPGAARGVGRGHQLRGHRGAQHDQLPRRSARQPDRRAHRGDAARHDRRAVVRVAAPAPAPDAGVRRRRHRADARCRPPSPPARDSCSRRSRW